MSSEIEKTIPSPCDEVGKKVSWKPNEYSQRLYGEVVKVYYDIGPDPRYPNTDLRALFRKLKIKTADDRVFTVSGEHEDIKKMGMVVDGESRDK